MSTTADSDSISTSAPERRDVASKSRLRRMPVPATAPRAPNITGILIIALGAIVLFVLREMKKLSLQVDRLRRIVGPAIGGNPEPVEPPSQTKPQNLPTMFGASFPAEFFGRHVSREKDSFARIEEESEEDDDDSDRDVEDVATVREPAVEETVAVEAPAPESGRSSKKKGSRRNKSNIEAE